MPLYPRHKTFVCGGCAHLRRHYVRDGSRYLPLPVGHCVHLRCKDREEGNTCPSWTPKRGR